MNWLAKQIDWLTAWCKSKNLTTHTIGATLVAFAFAYDGNQGVRDYIASLFAGHPIAVTKIGWVLTNIALGVTLWRNFSHSSSPAGIVAASKAIMSNGSAPTAAQIDAATTK